MSAAPVLALSIAWLLAFDYEAYRPSSLADIVKEQAATRTGDWNIVGADFRYRLSIVFSGEFRKIDARSQKLIGMWIKAVSADPKIAEVFTQEVKVVEAGASYWLPIQKTLVEPLKSEAKSGQKVDLFVTWIGSTKTDFILLVNEFDARAGT